MGQRALTEREKETYALVSCLLKFKSWITGRQVTVFTDHKSLESWHKEELCTMAAPLGRRGRWHEILSRYNIVVVYKPGVENDAGDGMSGWTYPGGLADDTNHHASDADLEGVTQWEGSEREQEQQLIAVNQYPRKVLEVRAPKGPPSSEDMQEQRERDHLLLQVNRLHNSVHYDSSSLPDDPAVNAVQSASDHCERCCPFPPCFSQGSMSLEEDSSSEAESSVVPDEAIWNVLDETDDAFPLCYSEGDPTWFSLASFGSSLSSKCRLGPEYCTRTGCPTTGRTERTNDSWIGVWRIRFPWMDTSRPRDHSGVITTFVGIIKFVFCSPLCFRSSGRYMHVPIRVRQRPWSCFYGIFTLTCPMPGCGKQ